MSKYSPQQARVTIGERYNRLTVRWTAADSWTFEDIKASFRSMFGRHSQACWNGHLKAWTLPHWQYDALSWWVASTFQREAVSWLDEDDDEGEGEGPAYRQRRTSDAHSGYRTPAVDPLADAYARLHLRATAPPELVDAAYRCLARLHHPDHVGASGEETMKALNSAVAIVREAQHVRAS